MLYKKYHRNFVRKFKIGVKLEGDFEIIDKVIIEPSIMKYNVIQEIS